VPFEKLTVLPGQQFGRLTVLEETRKAVSGRPAGRRAAKCQCSCGNIVVIFLSHLTSGCVVSCGCRRRDLGHELAKSPERLTAIRARFTTHGMAGHPLYGTYRNMVARCYDPRRKDFARYGGRGIGVHEEWLGDPAVFIAWIEANLGPRPTGMSLDRVDNEGNYEPGNVQWATFSEQQLNRRRRAA
jgi:hypothetical protein